MTCIPALARRAAETASGAERRVLGIAGPPGAGKTTLVERLLGRLASLLPAHASAGSLVAHLPMDGFHLADVQLDRLGLHRRKGAPETFDAAGYVAAIERVLRDDGTTIYAPGFARELEQPIAAAIAIPGSARLIITEGNYLLLPDAPWCTLRRLMGEIWYVGIPDDVRVTRLLQRHVRFGKEPSVARQWVSATDEANAHLVAATREFADLVIDGMAL